MNKKTNINHHNHEHGGCSKCILPKEYTFAEVNEAGECKFCNSFKERSFKGKERLFKDLDLKETEKLGLSTKVCKFFSIPSNSFLRVRAC